MPATPEPAPQLEQLTHEQFQRLPDTAAVELQGRRTTAGEIRARWKREAEETTAPAGRTAKQIRAEMETKRAEFLKQEQARLKAGNARVSAESASRRGGVVVTEIYESPPQITGTVGEFTPGAVVGIFGDHFGLKPRWVDLILTGGKHPLKILEWTPGLIKAEVPSPLTGQKDQNGSVHVTRHDGKESSWSVPFKAKRAVALLAGKHVQSWTCSPNTNNNACNIWSDTFTFNGFHACYVKKCSPGQDTFRFALKNGWTVKEISVKIAKTQNGYLGQAYGPEGAAEGQVGIPWHLAEGVQGFINYIVSIYIVGPEGVPYW
jgi:hypothetical protein